MSIQSSHLVHWSIHCSIHLVHWSIHCSIHLVVPPAFAPSGIEVKGRDASLPLAAAAAAASASSSAAASLAAIIQGPSIEHNARSRSTYGLTEGKHVLFIGCER